MTSSHSDALVFFGATGDLAYKKIFPALQAMAKRGHLNVPVVGVAKAGWNLDQLRARAKDSLEKHGGIEPTAFALTTTWASEQLTTCLPSVSPTPLSKPSGIATTSKVWKSPWRKISAYKAAEVFTTRPALFATWCRTIYFRCCRTWPWSHL